MTEDDLSNALMCGDECNNVWLDPFAIDRLLAIINWAQATAPALDDQAIVKTIDDLERMAQ